MAFMYSSMTALHPVIYYHSAFPFRGTNPSDNASSKEEDDGTDENQEEFDENNEEVSYPSDPTLN